MHRYPRTMGDFVRKLIDDLNVSAVKTGFEIDER